MKQKFFVSQQWNEFLEKWDIYIVPDDQRGVMDFSRELEVELDMSPPSEGELKEVKRKSALKSIAFGHRLVDENEKILKELGDAQNSY